MAMLTVIQYFETPHKSSAAAFIAFSSSALACFAAAVVLVMRPWSFESFLRRLLILLVCLYGGLFLMWMAARYVSEKGQVANSAANILVGVLSFQGAAVFLVCFFLREHQTGWRQGFGFGSSPGSALFWGVVVGFVALWTTMGILYLSNLLLELLNHQPQEQEAVTVLRAAEGWKDRLAMGIATIVIAPVGEEILFRGILYPWIKRIWSPRIALWATALVFAAIHVNLATFVPLTFLAIILVLLYEYTGNLLACMVTHALFNAANLVALYFYQK